MSQSAAAAVVVVAVHYDKPHLSQYQSLGLWLSLPSLILPSFLPCIQ